MKTKLTLIAMALSILGVTATPAAMAKPSIDEGSKYSIACFWAKKFLDERQGEYGHRYYDYGYDYRDTMIESDTKTIPEPPKMKTVEQWEGSKKVIRIIPDSGETQVVIFGGSQTK